MNEIMEVKGITKGYYKFRAIVALVKIIIVFSFLFSILILPALIAFFINQFDEDLLDYIFISPKVFIIFGLISVIGFIIYLIWLRSYIRTYEWKITESEIILKQGVFIRIENRIPFSKIQNVSIIQHYWERKFGWYKAPIKTEIPIGARPAESCIIGLRNATLIQNEILRRANRFLNTRTTSVEEIISRVSKDEQLPVEGIKFYDFREQLNKVIHILDDISKTLKKNTFKI